MTDAGYKKIFIFSFVFLLSGTVFLVGITISHYKVWPYKAVISTLRACKYLLKYGEIVPENLYVTPPPWASRERLTIYNPNLPMDGYYAFMGWDTNVNLFSAWLYNSDGQHIHTWAWDYSSFDLGNPLNGSDSPHAFKVLADGSLIVSFDDGDAMVRLDACSQQVWTKRGVYHHSLEKAEDGSYWTWRGVGTAYGYYNYLENFDPETGATIKEIGLIEDIVKNMGASSIVFGIRPDRNFLTFERTPADKEEHDIFHPNDIDILYSDLAHKFPNFKTGDLLLSFRNSHLIAVLDPNEKQIKWWSNGPWRFQHDPDFTADGKISVFNNNSDYGRSEIIKIDPTTREISNDLFNGEVQFYSHSMGKHQYLPNGNVLIIIPGEGRALEVTEQGDKVLEFNNVIPDKNKFNAHVENGLWLTSDYFDTPPRCLNDSTKEL